MKRLTSLTNVNNYIPNVKEHSYFRNKRQPTIIWSTTFNHSFIFVSHTASTKCILQCNTILWVIVRHRKTSYRYDNDGASDIRMSWVVEHRNQWNEKASSGKKWENLWTIHTQDNLNLSFWGFSMYVLPLMNFLSLFWNAFTIFPKNCTSIFLHSIMTRTHTC